MGGRKATRYLLDSILVGLTKKERKKATSTQETMHLIYHTRSHLKNSTV
jgi:hypothetical protein